MPLPLSERVDILQVEEPVIHNDGAEPGAGAIDAKGEQPAQVYVCRLALMHNTPKGCVDWRLSPRSGLNNALQSGTAISTFNYDEKVRSNA